MRLLIAGNLANTGYYLVSKLRKSGLPVDLLMEKNPSFASDPKNTHELIGNEYPDWIKFWNMNGNWKREVVKTMRKYNLISASTELPIFALFALKPYIAVATGSDLFYLAHSRTLKGILLRNAYRRAKVVIFTLPTHLRHVKELKLKNAIFLPLFRDFQESKTPPTRNKVKDKFVFFHPTNHVWDIKHNDVFLKAYVQLSKSRNDVFLILINRGQDAEKSINFLKKSNVEGKYQILPRTLSQSELVTQYQNCDAVVDQFGVGSFGFIGLEVMHQGKPLICYIEEESYEKLYGEKPPVLSAKDEEGIYQILKKLVENDQFCADISERSRKWISKFHSGDFLIKKYINLYNWVHEGKKFEEIAANLKFY